ncbi:F-box/kelch-repeat protein SKIP25 [Euphorbia lathyris]|uniref:F-box/kelch-repeat protein SKIP25 n=1 Tax=Euphorbia lathyris TaxID=212925 RepID=UPI00331343AC
MPNSVQIPAPVILNSAKRQKSTYRRRQDDQSTLIPGLPDHVAQLCLSRVPPSLLYSVCYSWRRLIYTPSFPPFLSLYTILSSTNSENDVSNDSIQFFSFDPISSRWDLLPPPPPDPPLRLTLRHPSFISRDLPIQSVVVSGNLVLLAATTDNLSPALSRPLVFNPLSRRWNLGPPLDTPRRWCAAGVVNDSIYVASGVGSQFSADLGKLVERWDFFRPKWKWKKVKGLDDGRFCREAIDAIPWRGKLCMVNVKGDAAKEGLVYDTEKDDWEDMPDGMLFGWKGPAAAMDEEVIYAVDEGKGALKKYDPEKDEWDSVMECDRFVGAQQIAAGGGRVCVVCGGSNRGEIVVVDVVAQPVKLWNVEMPPGFEGVAVHILPRMSQPELEFPGPLSICC